MSHQPYERFLFTKEALNNKQQNQLKHHLQECDNCHTLADALVSLEDLFSNSPTPQPAPGFTQRWQSRLVESHQKRQNRNLWLMTFGLFMLAAVILLFIFFLHLPFINMAYELSQFIARISRITAEVRYSFNIIRSITSNLPFIIPIIILLTPSTFLAITALIFTWFRAIIKLYAPIQERGKLS